MAPAKNEDEATEAARLVAFTPYGKVFSEMDHAAVATAQSIRDQYELQTSPGTWKQVFEDHMHDELPAVLVLPPTAVADLSGYWPESGTVIGVFERNGKLEFVPFN